MTNKEIKKEAIELNKKVDKLLEIIEYLIEDEKRKIRLEGDSDWYRKGMLDGLNISKTMIREQIKK